MHKKIIFSIISLSLCLCLGLAKTVAAEEEITPTSSDEATVEGVINPDEIDDSVEPTTVVDVEATETITVTPDDETEAENDLDHNGTSGEPLVVCADSSEPSCADEEIEPEMWTLYLSLGALGATVLLVLLINLIGRRKK